MIRHRLVQSVCLTADQRKDEYVLTKFSKLWTNFRTRRNDTSLAFMVAPRNKILMSAFLSVYGNICMSDVWEGKLLNTFYVLFEYHLPLLSCNVQRCMDRFGPSNMLAKKSAFSDFRWNKVVQISSRSVYTLLRIIDGILYHCFLFKTNFRKNRCPAVKRVSVWTKSFLANRLSY